MKNSSPASSSGPKTGCSVMPSRRCDQRRCVPCASITALAIVRASRCKRVTSLSGEAAMAGVSPRSTPASPAPSSASPRRRTATVAMTGRPRMLASRSVSMLVPSRSARSTMLSATSIGRPSRRSSSTKRRWFRKLVASMTATMASRRFSPLRWPSTASRVTCSSGDRGVRL